MYGNHILNLLELPITMLIIMNQIFAQTFKAKIIDEDTKKYVFGAYILSTLQNTDDKIQNSHTD